MADESSMAKKDYLKYNLRANIRSPTFFVKQFSRNKRQHPDSCLFRLKFEEIDENRAAEELGGPQKT
jgi:hypothetical protein